MKTYKILNKFSVILAGALLLALASCTEEVLRDASPAQAGDGIQAYIAETNPTAYVFLPDDPATSITVTIGRQNTQGRVEVPLSVTDEKNLLVLNDVVTFDDGQALAELAVDFSAMEVGQSTTLDLAVKNEADRYIYGLSEYSITISIDYKWVDRGSANFYDGFWTGETAKIPIQQAEGTQLFRFKDIYSEIFLALDPTDPDVEDCKGYHLQFYLDTTYTDASNTYRKCTAIALPTGVQDLGIGKYGYTFYWAPAGQPYASYCSFTNDGNAYTIAGLVLVSGAVTYYWNCQFTWDDGFPGIIPDPYKGETVVIENLTKTLTAAQGYYLGYQGYSYYDKDEYGSRTPVYVDNYIVQLEGDGLEVSLDVLALNGTASAIPVGTYTINSSNKENSVRVGNYAETASGTSSYAQLPAISSDLFLYLLSGTVTIEYDSSNYTITIDAVTAKGSVIQATWTGALTITDLS